MIKLYFALIQGLLLKMAASHDASKCEEMRWQEDGKPWVFDDDCCAFKKTGRCKDGYQLEWSDKTCYENKNAKAFKYECIKNEIQSLPPMGADLSTLTISGFSSGAYMAMQLHIVHSAIVKGVALHEGGPYGMSWAQYRKTLKVSIDLARKAQEEGEIDQLSNLKESPVIISSGLKDTVVRPHQ